MKRHVYHRLLEWVRFKADAAHIADVEKYFCPEGMLKGENEYIRLASSLQNGTSSGMDKSIRFHGVNREAIEAVIFGGDAHKVLETYADATQLYAALCERVVDRGAVLRRERAEKETDDVKRRRIERRPTVWEKYAGGLYSGAGFLIEQDALLRELIALDSDQPFDGERVSAALATIRAGIHGLGTALACDWLKEIGCTWVAKPDVHIKAVCAAMLSAEGRDVAEKALDDIDVVAYYYDWARELRQAGEEVTAYKLDKLVWLTCTGDFYLDRDVTVGRDTIVEFIRGEST